jgi:hypothetical protein
MNRTKRTLLIQALVNRPQEHDLLLKKLQNEAIELTHREDWLWHLLLSSMSTMGNSRGYEGLIQNLNNYGLVSHSTLKTLDPINRLSNLREGLRAATVRRYNYKANWLDKNFEFIESCGGLKTVQTFILQTTGRDCKLRLLQLFEGIGDKYARNIFMDLYHADFINSIAIDERLLDISNELEIDNQEISYLEHEQLFIAIANDAMLTPWSLDRVLYNFKQYYIDVMSNSV